MASDISKLSKSQDPPVLASQFVQVNFEQNLIWNYTNNAQIYYYVYFWILLDI